MLILPQERLQRIAAESQVEESAAEPLCCVLSLFCIWGRAAELFLSVVFCQVDRNTMAEAPINGTLREVDEDDALLEVDGSVARSGRLCGTLTRTHAATAPAMSTGIVTFNAAEREDECGLEDGGGLVGGFVDEDDALLEVDGSVALRVRVALVIASLCPLRLLLRSPYASRFAAGRITGRRGEGEGGMRRGQNEK